MQKEKEVNRSSFNNTVKIVGVLKENNLEHIVDSYNKNIIRGSVIIATDKKNAHKVQFYVSEFTQQGAESSAYLSLMKMLPENTTTVASCLKTDPDATYDSAMADATKVWVIAKLDEYAYRSGERTNSLLTLKGVTMGESTKAENYAEFNVDLYIGAMEPELDESEQETGRLCITGYVPRYDQSMDVIHFIAVKEDNVAKYVSTNYKVGDSVSLCGDLINMQDRILKQTEEDPADAGAFFGKKMRDDKGGEVYETRFIHELRVSGGSKVPYSKTDTAYISAEMVKNGLAAREIRMDKNGKKSKGSSFAKENSESTPTRKAPQKSFASSVNDSDIDF